MYNTFIFISFSHTRRISSLDFLSHGINHVICVLHLLVITSRWLAVIHIGHNR